MTNEWDQVAEEYSQNTIGEQGGLKHQSVIAPEIRKFTENLAVGTKVLDLGCGEGYVGRLLADRGFQLVGVDYSEKLLDIAKSRNAPGQFIKTDLNKQINVGNDFDLVISNMVFMDVENLQSAYRNAYNSLKSGGNLLIFILHPVLARPAAKLAKTWLDKILRRDPFIRVDNYLQEGPRKVVICGCRHATTVWHRPLMQYINFPISIGFNLVEFRELASNIVDIERLRKPRFLAKIPQVVMLRFVKNGKN